MLADVKPESSTPTEASETEINILARQIREKYNSLYQSHTSVNRVPTNQRQVTVLEQVDSSVGKFGWEVIEKEVCLPFIKRDNQDSVALFLVAYYVIKPFTNYLSEHVINSLPYAFIAMKESEASVFNEINTIHTDRKLVGNHKFNAEDLMMSLEDVKKAANFFNICYKALFHKVKENDLFGFVKIAGANSVPFVWSDSKKLVPLFYFDGQGEFLNERAIELKDAWKLLYLKFCCKVQNIKKGHYERTSLMVVYLEDVSQLFTEDTRFELCWPDEVNPEMFYGGSARKGQVPQTLLSKEEYPRIDLAQTVTDTLNQQIFPAKASAKAPESLLRSTLLTGNQMRTSSQLNNICRQTLKKGPHEFNNKQKVKSTLKALQNNGNTSEVVGNVRTIQNEVITINDDKPSQFPETQPVSARSNQQGVGTPVLRPLSSSKVIPGAISISTAVNQVQTQMTTIPNGSPELSNISSAHQASAKAPESLLRSTLLTVNQVQTQMTTIPNESSELSNISSAHQASAKGPESLLRSTLLRGNQMRTSSQLNNICRQTLKKGPHEFNNKQKVKSTLKALQNNGNTSEVVGNVRTIQNEVITINDDKPSQFPETQPVSARSNQQEAGTPVLRSLSSSKVIPGAISISTAVNQVQTQMTTIPNGSPELFNNSSAHQASAKAPESLLRSTLLTGNQMRTSSQLNNICRQTLKKAPHEFNNKQKVKSTLKALQNNGNTSEVVGNVRTIQNEVITINDDKPSQFPETQPVSARSNQQGAGTPVLRSLSSSKVIPGAISISIAVNQFQTQMTTIPNGSPELSNITSAHQQQPQCHITNIYPQFVTNVQGVGQNQYQPTNLYKPPITPVVQPNGQIWTDNSLQGQLFSHQPIVYSEEKQSSCSNLHEQDRASQPYSLSKNQNSVSFQNWFGCTTSSGFQTVTDVFQDTYPKQLKQNSDTSPESYALNELSILSKKIMGISRRPSETEYFINLGEFMENIYPVKKDLFEQVLTEYTQTKKYYKLNPVQNQRWQQYLDRKKLNPDSLGQNMFMCYDQLITICYDQLLTKTKCIKL